MGSLLCLPGNDPGTEAWIGTLADALLPDAPREIVAWRHWSTALPPDPAFEAAALAGRTPDVVIAKSFGTLVAARACSDGRLAPGRLLLLGVPADSLGADDVARLGALARSKGCLFVQQRDDVTGRASTLRALLPASAELLEVSGSDHRYATDEIQPVLDGWP